MEFQLSLLNNEIEHLNKNMGLMSEELIVLKEFIRQEFSTRFEAFCNARRDKQRHATVSNVPIVAARSSTSKMVQKSGGGSAPLIEIKTEPEPIYEPEMDQSLFYNESNLDNLDSSDENNDDDSDQDFDVKHGQFLDPLKPTSTSIKGKPKSMIHKYFEQIPTPEGKIRAKCYTCQEFVSNQAQRLKNHFAKCSSSNKLNMDSKVVKRLTTVGFKRPSGTAGGDDATKIGRKADRVRELFDLVRDESGCHKMKCLNCGHLVSNQAGRMRKHIEKCDGKPESLSPKPRKTYASKTKSSVIQKTEPKEDVLSEAPLVQTSQEISPANSNTPIIENYPNPNPDTSETEASFMQI